MERASDWFARDVDEVLEGLASHREGLTAEEAERRLAEHGPNELPTSRGSVWPRILLAQFKSVLILILIGAAVLSIFLGDVAESVVILAIVVMSIGLGFLQEFRAERALDALRDLAAPHADVVRSGVVERVDARTLVVGDILQLAAGDRVPADVRLLHAANLRVDEASLTGESVPVAKDPAPTSAATCPVADRTSMAFAGTVVSYGRGVGVVTATATDTEFGRVTDLLAGVRRTVTPLQENLDRLGRILALAALAIVLLVMGLGFLAGDPLLEMFLLGVALAVAAVPEALPAVVTVSLALGVQRMARRNALVRHLPAVETLGATSVICADKTGTLTQNEMTVRELYANGHRYEVTGTGYEPEGRFEEAGQAIVPPDALRTLLVGAVLCNDAELVSTEDGWEIRGDPTEGALIVAAAKAGLEKQALEGETPRVGEIPFTSEARRMTTFHGDGSTRVVYAKGALEAILDACALGEEAAATIRAEAGSMAERALRVLAVACKAEGNLTDESDGMSFLGLVGMIDPPRPGAKDAIARCRRAGIRPVMITGDHPETARAVAREIGLLDGGRVIGGAELEAWSRADLERRIEEVDVYARVEPGHKLRVVEAWQARGRTVAMTGDGVNDAPALKRADVGVAMGRSGTDVSREAADMTLTDDNFASIVGAVEEGRAIFANIRKYLMYLLSSNIGEVGVIAGAAVLGWPLPLTAVQILYVNLATDGLPALALAVDPPEDDLMRRPPRDPHASIFTRAVVFLTVLGGLWSMSVNLALFEWARRSGRDLSEAMTMTFVALVLIQFFKAYSFRSDQASVFRRPWANRWLNLAVTWETGLLLVVVYLPALHGPFGTHALTVLDWLIVGLASASVLPVLELAKAILRRGHST